MSATTPTASPTPYISANCLVVRPDMPSVSTLPMSPMCWLIQASRPDARQKVFFSSPPTAMLAGGIEGEAHGEGVAPLREWAGPRRRPRHRVVAGAWMGRSWTSQAPAMGPRRRRASTSSWQIGSSLRFPLVMTARPGRGRRRPVRPGTAGGGAGRTAAGCRRTLQGATSGDSSSSTRRRIRTMGRCGLARRAASWPSISARTRFAAATCRGP